jgi:hypothetical protein
MVISECKNGYISGQTWNITFVDRWIAVMFPWDTNFVKTDEDYSETRHAHLVKYLRFCIANPKHSLSHDLITIK